MSRRSLAVSVVGSLLCFAPVAQAQRPAFRVVTPIREAGPIDVSQDVREALESAGCSPSAASDSAVTVKASLIKTTFPHVCSYSIEATQNGKEIYRVPKEVPAANCSEQWLKDSIRLHVKNVCDKAVLTAIRQENEDLNSRNAALEVSTKPSPEATAPSGSFPRWALPSLLIASGVGAMGWGTYALAKDGADYDCGPSRCWSRYANNGTQGALFLGVGGAVTALGAWWLWNSLSEQPSQTSVLVGPGSVALKGRF